MNYILIYTGKCPPLDSSHLQFECSTNGAVVDCLKEMVNGTRATVNCRPTHHLPNGIEPTPTILICLPDGKWDGQLFKCVPCNYILVMLFKCLTNFIFFIILILIY